MLKKILILILEILFIYCVSGLIFNNWSLTEFLLISIFCISFDIIDTYLGNRHRKRSSLQQK